MFPLKCKYFFCSPFWFTLFFPVREILPPNWKIFAASRGSKNSYVKEHPLMFYPVRSLSRCFRFVIMTKV